MLNVDARFTNDPWRAPKPQWLTDLVRDVLTDYVGFRAVTCPHLADPTARHTASLVAPDPTVICGDCLGAVLTRGGFPHAHRACVGCGEPAELTTLTTEYSPDVGPVAFLTVASFVCWTCGPRGAESRPW